MAHSSGSVLVLLGLCLAAYSFVGPGFQLLIAGAVLMTIGGVLQSQKE
jgi:hypothetical protein